MASGPNPLLVVDVPRLSWTRRVALFSSVFAGLWVFLGPLFELGGVSSLLRSLGLWGYAALVGVSALSVIGVEAVRRRRHLGTLDLIDIEILFTSTGQRVSVRASSDMLVGRVVEKVLGVAAGLATFGTLLSVLQSLYETNLLVARDGRYRQVSNRKTLREAGIRAGDICKIRGYIRAEYNAPLANIAGSAKAARVEQGRAAGNVYFDEDTAVDLDEAVAKGIITRARANALQAGARSGTRFFVVDNSSGGSS
jgi:hypothetical protein